MSEPIDPSDQQLVEAANNGDFEAFRSIVVRYSNALLAVAYSVINDFHEAQDVTQETWMKVFQQLHTINDPSQLGSWLYTIAYRTSLDFAKKKKTNLPFTEMVVPNSEQMNGWVDTLIIRETISRALCELEEKSKTSVVLFYLSNWSMKEIAKFMDLSVAAVESRIRRGREVLKQHLADDFDSYFRPYQLDNSFVEKVSVYILRRIGHYYIPVLNRERTTQWFVDHFHLNITEHGNLQLDSGDLLYLLESQSSSPVDVPVLTFSVADIDDLWHKLNDSGVRIMSIETNIWLGSYFLFYDPDGNPYYAADHKTSAVMTD